MKKLHISLVFLLPLIFSFAFLPVLLKISVVDELGNPQRGAVIKVYQNESDYNADENPIRTVTTNIKGKVTIKKLKTSTYYVRVTLKEKNNDQGGVMTGRLVKGINKITIVIK